MPIDNIEIWLTVSTAISGLSLSLYARWKTELNNVQYEYDTTWKEVKHEVDTFRRRWYQVGNKDEKLFNLSSVMYDKDAYYKFYNIVANRIRDIFNRLVYGERDLGEECNMENIRSVNYYVESLKENSEKYTTVGDQKYLNFIELYSSPKWHHELRVKFNKLYRLKGDIYTLMPLTVMSGLFSLFPLFSLTAFVSLFPITGDNSTVFSLFSYGVLHHYADAVAMFGKCSVLLSLPVAAVLIIFIFFSDFIVGLLRLSDYFLKLYYKESFFNLVFNSTIMKLEIKIITLLLVLTLLVRFTSYTLAH